MTEQHTRPKLTPRRFLRWLNAVQPDEIAFLGGAAVFVGLASGVSVWLFKQAFDGLQALMFTNVGGWLAGFGPWTIVLIPVLGGLIVGLLVHFFIGEERHHGVAGIMESVALAGGHLRYRRLPIKIITAIASIGFGASVGPEDPSVQIGANLGSMVGQVFRLSDERMRSLVAAGSAAGIAAAFNAPIAGVFFALELIIGELGSGALGAIMLAAVVSAVFSQAVEGPQPAFRVPAYAFHSAVELPLYLVLGLLAGPVAALYIRLLYRAHDIFHGWEIPSWLKPAVAGLLVGITGIFLPQIFGVGYNTIEAILNSQSFTILILLALVAAKVVMTPVSIGGGFLGGVFAPSLFLGATLGAAFGQIADLWFPALGLNVPAFAMVGMAAVLAGAVHAPLTAIILLFEMTNDYRIILPLMFAVTVSLFISQRLQQDSVYELGLARKGIRLNRGRDVELLEQITVKEIMRLDMEPLRADDTVEQAAAVFARTRHHGLPVLNAAGELVGIFTVSDLDRMRTSDADTNRMTILEACTQEILTIYPNETIGRAMRRMSAQDIGRSARGGPR